MSTILSNCKTVLYQPVVNPLSVVPPGGDEDQFLSKIDGDDYNYEWVDLPSIPVHTNQTSVFSYTGMELPTIDGVNVGDTTTTKFANGFFANFTWDGAIWVLDNDDYYPYLELNILTPVDTNFISAGEREIVLDIRETNDVQTVGDLVINFTKSANFPFSYNIADTFSAISAVDNYLYPAATFSNVGLFNTLTIPSFALKGTNQRLLLTVDPVNFVGTQSGSFSFSVSIAAINILKPCVTDIRYYQAGW